MDNEKQPQGLPTNQTPPTGVAPSASGPNGPFPQELAHWNWGAFFLSWIWAIGNSVWIGLLALLGPIALIMAIVLGVKGNEWAWQNRKFESVEQFKSVQKKWAIWGLVLFLVIMIGMVVILTMTVFRSTGTAKVKSSDAQAKSDITLIETAIEMYRDSQSDQSVPSDLNQLAEKDLISPFPIAPSGYVYVYKVNPTDKTKYLLYTNLQENTPGSGPAADYFAAKNGLSEDVTDTVPTL